MGGRKTIYQDAAIAPSKKPEIEQEKNRLKEQQKYLADLNNFDQEEETKAHESQLQTEKELHERTQEQKKEQLERAKRAKKGKLDLIYTRKTGTQEIGHEKENEIGR